MGRVVAIWLLAMFALAGCAKDATVRVAADQLPGAYHSGDGLGRMVTVSLREDGTFKSVWEGCLGVYGEAEGTWRLVGDRVMFEPSSESEMLVSYLSSATTIRDGGRLGFVREQDVSRDRVGEELVFFRVPSSQ
jgi:hypothetical protein